MLIKVPKNATEGSVLFHFVKIGRVGLVLNHEADAQSLRGRKHRHSDFEHIKLLFETS